MPQICFWSAVAALGEDDADIAPVALDLIRKLLRIYPEKCAGAFGDFQKFAQWGAVAFADWIRHPKVAISEHAIRAAVPFFAAAPDSLPLAAILVEQSRGRDQKDVVARCFAAFKKMFAAKPQEMAVHVREVLEVSLAGLSRMLPCPVQDDESEEERFEYDCELQPRIHDALVAAIEAYGTDFPMQPIIDRIKLISHHISAIEVCGLIGVLASFADVGGDVPPPLVGLALGKLEACDFYVMPEPIFFARVMIREWPARVAGHVPQVVQFLARLLSEPESRARYYWNTVTNAIAAVFEIAFSQELAREIALPEFIGSILAHLPVRGDLQEAAFIYESLVRIAAAAPEILAPHGEELFRVLTETLAATDRWFHETGIHGGLVQNLAQLLQSLPGSEQAVATVLGGDQIKIARLQARVTFAQ
jgi:hypothetical protein